MDRITGLVWILAIPHTNGISLGPDISEPQLPYLENRNKNSYVMRINQDYACSEFSV